MSGHVCQVVFISVGAALVSAEVQSHGLVMKGPCSKSALNYVYRLH